VEKIHTHQILHLLLTLKTRVIHQPIVDIPHSMLEVTHQQQGATHHKLQEVTHHQQEVTRQLQEATHHLQELIPHLHLHTLKHLQLHPDIPKDILLLLDNMVLTHLQGLHRHMHHVDIRLAHILHTLEHHHTHHSNNHDIWE